MKDSGIPWVGDIPDTWNVEKVKGFLRKHEVKGHGDATVLALYRDHGVVPKDSRDDNHNRTGKDTNDYKFVRKGDLVINKMKAWQGSLSVSGYEGIVSPAYFIYEFIGNRLDGHYADYLLRSTYKQEFERVSGGIREGQWDLPRYDFEHMQLPIPSLDEQQSIADYLDACCSEIDSVKQTLSDEIEALQRLRKATIQKAVTKGLVKSALMKDSGVDWLEYVPNEWNVLPSKHVFFESKQLRLSDKDPQLTPSQRFGVVTQKEYMRLMDSRIVLANTGLDKWRHVQPNDFIISLRSFQGGLEMSEISGCVTWHYIVLRAKRAIVPRYYKYLFKTERYIVALQQTCSFIRDGQDLRYSNFVQVKLPYPPLDVQQQIADYLDERSAAIDSIIDTRTKQLERLEDYRKALIFAYVTGKKEVPSHE